MLKTSHYWLLLLAPGLACSASTPAGGQGAGADAGDGGSGASSGETSSVGDGGQPGSDSSVGGGAAVTGGTQGTGATGGGAMAGTGGSGSIDAGGEGNKGGQGGASQAGNSSAGADAGASTGGQGGAGEAGAGGAPPLPAALTWERQGSRFTVQDIWGSSQSDVYAVGLSGVIAHSTGDGMWTEQVSGTSANLYGIWGSGPNDIYVAVDSNVILHSTGNGEWEHQAVEAGERFSDIWGADADNVFALGGGLRRRSSTTGWSAREGVANSAPLRSIWASSATNIYIATGTPTASIIYHSNEDGSWSPEDAPDLAAAVTVWGVDAANVYAGVPGAALFSSGDGRWTESLSAPDDVVEAIWGSSQTEVFACTTRGMFYRSNGRGIWSDGELFHDPELSIGCIAMWGTASDNVYLGTSGGIFHSIQQ